MSKEKLLLVGAGGFGRMVAEQAMLQYDCAFVDDGQSVGAEICGIPVVGGLADLPKLRKEYSLLVVGIGNNQFRAQVYEKAKSLGYAFPNIIAPSAYVSPFAEVGCGCVVLQNACIQNAAYENVVEDKFPQQSNGKYREKMFEQFYHAIKRHNAAFEREIVPLDLLTPQFVQPNRDNPRILKQDGAFIISGLDASDKESDNKIREFLVKELIIPKEAKEQLRKELEYVGINQASLFPEVDKVADYLRRMV